MSQTLYRKYRPQSFQEIEGQEHIVRTLTGALLSGNVGHAYLFSGPRGTGKTTLARLFAKALNCQQQPHYRGLTSIEPCNRCDSCLAVNNNNSLDLIEIDAASNRGIEEIRNLKESARVAAPGGDYKIFIIDEVHMLTKDAFNALLKTLEEPPAHVLFILATTEPHKLLETILSRVQRLDFKKISHANVVKKLKRVAQAEELKIEEGALAALAAHSGGSLRDAESALAKLVSYAGDGQTITAAHTAEVLGIMPVETHERLLAAIVRKDSALAMATVSELYENGVDLENFTKQFINHLRGKLLAVIAAQPQFMKTGAGQAAGPVNAPEQLVQVINVFIRAKTELKSSPLPQLPLELAVLALTQDGSH